MKDRKENNNSHLETAGDTTVEESSDIMDINTNEIDFDFSEVIDVPGSFIADDYQSINPLENFSHKVEIDLERLNKEGYITPHHSNSILSSTYRMIKRPLLNNIDGKGASKVDHVNLIMLTSSLPSEGKTFSAINLAISIAMEQNKHVLLIDADLNKPSHFKIFGIDKMPGLTDVLLGEVDNVSDVLCRTNIPKLSVMSTGKGYDYSTELLASEAMSKFVNEVSTRYQDRVIIFDSPPLLQTTEAGVLATHMGQVILVVEAETTLNHIVKRSIDMLTNEITLLLLNKQREKNKVGDYGYGYGYGYGNGHAQNQS